MAARPGQLDRPGGWGEFLYEFAVGDEFAATHAPPDFYAMVKRWEAEDAEEEATKE